MKTTENDVIVIGGGIGGLMALYYSAKKWEMKFSHSKNPIKRVVLFDGSDFFPSSSIASSAVAALRGAQNNPNPSPYSQDLVNSFQKLNEFFQEHQENSFFIGIEKVKLTDIDRPMMEEVAFLFNPPQFLNFLKTLIASKLKQLEIEFFIRPELISSLENIKYYRCISALGAYSLIFKPDYMKQCDLEGKIVQGTYLYCESQEKRPSFVVQSHLQKNSMSYSSLTKLWKMGVASNERTSLIPNKEDLFGLYQFWSAQNFSLPPFEEWKVKTGVRHKISRKLPRVFFSEDHKIAHFHGAYKNGYLLPFLDGQKIANELFRD
ncbi:MAG: hypothetical protein QE271_12300 [Bacteriovoracaceae bacterium]|nr:hypothetical protein [Bacteriovoracaceae bacterium]